MMALPLPDADAAAHGARVVEHVTRLIAESGGAIPFSTYMDAVLYAPGLGYYSAGSHKLGEGGDFVTAPELSPLFARCFARQFAEIAAGDGILELGAGSGRFAAGVLAELAAVDALPDRYRILEVSADLRARQRQTLEALAPALMDRVEWLDTLPAAVDGVVFANEVLDALPVERFRIARDGIEQCVVASRDGRFGWETRAAPDALRAAVERIAADTGPLPAGFESEVCIRMTPFVRSIAESLRRGVLLLVDYGMSRREYYVPERASGTLMCHYRQRAHHDPFVWPGLQDITAHVDFTLVAEAATDAGMELCGYSTQAHYLMAAGLGDLLAEPVADERAGWLRAQQARRLTLPGEMGERFKVIGFCKGGAVAPSGFSLRDLSGRL